MARLDNLTREQLKPEDQQFFDEISGSRGSVRGPYGVLLHSPKLAARVAHTGTHVRFDFDWPEALKETVILATASEIKSQYEFTAHAILARKAGASESTIKALADGTAPAGLSGDEELVVRYTPLRRKGNPSDIGPLLVFLCSESCDYCTGQPVYIDGGLNAHP